MRLNYSRTFLLGCAFLGVQVLFSVYNAYVPIFLQSGRPDFAETGAITGGFGLSATLTGFVMTLDNLAAILILPYIGAISDATVSRLGKRKPYILLGAPIAALAFAAIPLMLGQPLPLFMAVVIVMVLAADVIRTPIISLMPDITPSPLRSQANGIINLMGGVGAVLAFAISGALYRQSSAAPFFFAAAALLVGCLLVIALVPVPVDPDARGVGGLWGQIRAALQRQEGAIFDDLRASVRDDRSLVFLLAAIFSCFLAYSALTVFFTSFATVSLQVERGQESTLLAFFALAIVVFALPSGLIGARFGRRVAVVAGLTVFAITLAMIGGSADLGIIRALLVLAGFAWAIAAVNLLPMVLDSAPTGQIERLGVYTGLYYLASQSAEVVGPVLVGAFLDATGRDYRLMFVYTPLALLVAIALMLRVRRGEAYTLRVKDESGKITAET
jgi:Na+/melibiose symporter-like transporter